MENRKVEIRRLWNFIFDCWWYHIYLKKIDIIFLRILENMKINLYLFITLGRSHIHLLYINGDLWGVVAKK